MLNADDPRVAAFGSVGAGARVDYGIDKPADFSAAGD